MKLPMVDLAGQYQKIKHEINAKVQEVLDSTQFILGKHVGEFEKQAAEFLGVKHAIGCANGTDALQIALMALGIGRDDEVITPSFTFVATAEAIATVGATPMFVDIDERTYNIDAALIEQAITPRTKAIMPVHLFGQAADMDAILEIARRHNLYVIEDAAQAFGAEYKGRKVCTFGTTACVSFFPSKNLGAYGDAGMLTTNDAALAKRMRMITVHGSKVKYVNDILGRNSRLDTLQAAILLVKIKYLDEWNEARRRAAAKYHELLSDMDAVLPYIEPFNKHIFHQYSIRVNDRDGLAKHLAANGIAHAIYYPIPIHLQKAFAYLGWKEGSLHVTEQVAKEIIALPMHTELTDEQIEYIADAVKAFVKKGEVVAK
jgi:dTDP-4-amino-4,6-dideoxygalactose transaminase